MAEKDSNTNIWKKLLAIQKQFTSFEVSEDSEKKNNGGKPAYQFTPGWQIVEGIRKAMDAANLMLIPEYEKDDVRLIEYPLYKLVEGKPVTFTKKEIHIVLTANFTWMDVDSGEKAGPFRIVASGANGTDKSCASALALAERYFLLKFFHITTHDKDEEPDAHDSGTVPGIPTSEQPYNAPYNAAPQPVICPAMPAGGAYLAPPQPACAQPFYGTPQGPYISVPQSGQTAPVAPSATLFDVNHPAIENAVQRLANFQLDTPTFQTELNKVICELASVGFKSFDPLFLENLREASQARREGRQPILK